MDAKRKELKARAKNISPTIRLGKSGLTDAAIDEIKKQLKKRKLIKIKLLRSFLKTSNKKDAAALIAEKTASSLIDQVGNVIVIYKQ